MIGPNKAFDTNKFFVISSNILGGCRGTTGPSLQLTLIQESLTDILFPVITVEDIIKGSKKLIDFLGVKNDSRRRLYGRNAGYGMVNQTS